MSRNKEYKKILIIGQSFNNSSGGGITLTNLFSKWPKNKIAVATYGSSIKNMSVEYTSSIYILGDEEVSYAFPFSLFNKKHKSGVFVPDPDTVEKTKRIIQKNPPLRMFLLNTVFSFVRKSGVYNFIMKVTSSKNFLNWVTDFNPDIIYTQIGSLAYLNFVTDVVEKLQKPVMVHIMDDWPSTMPGYFGFLYKKKIHQKIQYFFDLCSVHIGISDGMAEEYSNRYGYEWSAFQNCIDFEFWSNATIKNFDFSNGKKFTILYAGRVGTGTTTSLYEIAEKAEELVNEGFNISFEVQTNYPNHSIVKKLSKLKCVKFIQRVPYEELPKRFSSVNLLVLPIDFDKRGSRFLQYSMPTKVPEYMASGTPILVYSPKFTALSVFAKKNNIAMVVNEKKDLKTAIKNLIQNPDIAQAVSEIAINFARANQDCSIVQENFYKTILEAK